MNQECRNPGVNELPESAYLSVLLMKYLTLG